ncbi:hypothetical protein OROMI_017456 [Orobanche minor]
MNSGKVEKTLREWKLPRSSPSDVFKGCGFFNFPLYPKVQTVEKEIPLSEGYASFPLFPDHNLETTDCHSQYWHLQVGMIQVALKPTKLGLNTSAIICLRDNRFIRFHDSVMGMVESTLRDGPIYFSYFPNYSVAWSDRHNTFTIDIKTQGCSGGGEGNPILMYRFHYKVERGARPAKNFLEPRPSLVVDGRGETTLFCTNYIGPSRSNRVVSKKIYWNQVSVPEIWMDESNPSSAAGAGEEGEVARMADWKEAAAAAGAYALKVDVSGFKTEEVKVEVEAGRVLLISGERRRLNELEDEDGKWQCIERSSGKFLRRFNLPENAKMDDVTAEIENGVMTVTVPKEEVKEEKRQVKVVHISAG